MISKQPLYIQGINSSNQEITKESAFGAMGMFIFLFSTSIVYLCYHKCHDEEDNIRWVCDIVGNMCATWFICEVCADLYIEINQLKVTGLHETGAKGFKNQWLWSGDSRLVSVSVTGSFTDKFSNWRWSSGLLELEVLRLVSSTRKLLYKTRDWMW